MLVSDHYSFVNVKVETSMIHAMVMERIGATLKPGHL